MHTMKLTILFALILSCFALSAAEPVAVKTTPDQQALVFHGSVVKPGTVAVTLGHGLMTPEQYRALLTALNFDKQIHEILGAAIEAVEPDKKVKPPLKSLTEEETQKENERLNDEGAPLFHRDDGHLLMVTMGVAAITPDEMAALQLVLNFDPVVRQSILDGLARRKALKK